METSLGSFVSSFLQCMEGKPATKHQVEVVTAVARRAEFEKLTQGDFVIPLNSSKLKSVVDATTPLGKLLLNPSEENIKLVEEALKTCRLPVQKAVVLNKMLQIYLDRGQVMKTYLPRIAKAGLRYGACKILQQVDITVRHKTLDPIISSLRNQRGAKLVNHLCSILAFCGATVNRGEMQSQAAMLTNKSSVTSIHEQCKPQTTEASVGGKRQCKRHVEFRGGSEMREKQPHIETSISHTREDESMNAVQHATEAKMHVACTLQAINTPGTQSQHVSERTEASVTGEEIAAQESPHTQEEQVVSEMEFLVTSSMKGVKDSPWVYQCGEVVEARSGKIWTGCVQEYCRLLVEEMKRTSEMRQREMDGLEWEAFLKEQAERCLTLQLLSPTHSKPLRVEVHGDTHNIKGDV